MSRKELKLEVVEDSPVKTLKLSPAEIEVLEREKAVLLAQKVGEIPWSRQPAKTHEVTADESPLDVVTVEGPKPGEVAALQAQIEKNHADHVKDIEERDAKFALEQNRLLDVARDFEERGRKAHVAGTAARLVASMAVVEATSPGVAASLLAHRTAEAEDRQRWLRERAAPAVNTARAATRALKRFDADYAEILASVSTVGRDEWLEGTASEGAGAYAASAAYSQLWNALEAIKAVRDCLDSSLDPRPRWLNAELVGGFEAEIDNMIALAATRSWNPDLERSWIWATTRLALVSPEQVETMVNHVNAVVTATTWFSQRKRVENTAPRLTVDSLPEVPRNLRERQTRAITSTPFDDRAEA